MDPIVRRLRESRKPSSAHLKKVEDTLNNQLFGDELYVRVTDLEIVSETPTKITFKVDYTVTISIPYYDEEAEREYEETEEEYRTRTLILDKSDLEESSSQALSPEEMRAELVKDGDYTNEEAAKLKGLDLAKAYSSLPKRLGESDEYTLKHVPAGHIAVHDKSGNFVASFDTEQEARDAISKGELSAPASTDTPAASSQTYTVTYVDSKDNRGTVDVDATSDVEARKLASKKLSKGSRVVGAYLKIKDSVDVSVGSTFKNANFTWEILAIKGDYALVYADKKKWHPYVVAWKLSDDGSWAQGHYFADEAEAKKYLNKKA